MRLSPLSQPHAAACRSTVPLSKQRPFARPLAATTQYTNGLNITGGLQSRCSSGGKEAAKNNAPRRGRRKVILWEPAKQSMSRLALQTSRDNIQLFDDLRGRWDEEFARRKERWYRDGATQQQSFEQEQEDLMFLIQLHDVLLEGMGGTLARFRASREKVMRLSKTRRWGELLLELRRRQGALRRAAGRFQELLWPQCTEEELSDVEEGATGTAQAPPKHQQQAKKEEERAGQQRAPAAAVEPEEHGNYGKPRQGRGGVRPAAKEGTAPARKAPARGHGRKRRSTSMQDVKPTQVLELNDSEESLAPSEDDE